MAKAYVCDRCGKLITKEIFNEANKMLYEKEIFTHRFRDYCAGDAYDLCCECAKSLINWWEESKRRIKDAHDE